MPASHAPVLSLYCRWEPMYLAHGRYAQNRGMMQMYSKLCRRKFIAALKTVRRYNRRPWGNLYLSRVWNTLMYGTIASFFGSAASTCSRHMPQDDCSNCTCRRSELMRSCCDFQITQSARGLTPSMCQQSLWKYLHLGALLAKKQT